MGTLGNFVEFFKSIFAMSPFTVLVGKLLSPFYSGLKTQYQGGSPYTVRGLVTQFVFVGALEGGREHVMSVSESAR